MARLLIAVADFRDAPGRPFHLTFSQAKKKAKFRHLNRCRFMSPDVSRPIYTRSVWLKCMLYARGIGLWLLRSRAEGAWSQGVSHSLGFLSFPFDLQNFKTNKQKLPGPDRLNHLQTAPKWKKKNIYLKSENIHVCVGQGFLGLMILTSRYVVVYNWRYLKGLELKNWSRTRSDTAFLWLKLM